MRSGEGYARATYRYDRLGNMTEEAFWDEKGARAVGRDGYARWTGQYDDAGNLREGAFFDKAGRLQDRSWGETAQSGAAVQRQRPARETWSYDEHGFLRETAVYKANGKPMPGYSRTTFGYDAAGRLREETQHLSTDGAAAQSPQACAYQSFRYNEQGQGVEFACYNARRALEFDPGRGVTREAWVHDEIGRLEGRALYGADGALSRYGAARITISYDEHHAMTVTASSHDGQILFHGKPVPFF